MGVSQTVSALLFVGLCLYVWFGSVRKTRELTHDPRAARVDLGRGRRAVKARGRTGDLTALVARVKLNERSFSS